MGTVAYSLVEVFLLSLYSLEKMSVERSSQFWPFLDARSEVVADLSVGNEGLLGRDESSRYEMPLIVLREVLIDGDIQHGGFL
jgi:hypothetical protein